MNQDLARLMESRTAARDADVQRSVRYYVVAFFAVIVVALGLVIVDANVGKIIGEPALSTFRTVLFLSILVAGVGARSLLAWRSATVDLQGRIFLTAMGLVLLTAAASGLAYCRNEIEDASRHPRVDSDFENPPRVAVSTAGSREAMV